jgi:hypothetical protein
MLPQSILGNMTARISDNAVSAGTYYFGSSSSQSLLFMLFAL